MRVQAGRLVVIAALLVAASLVVQPATFIRAARSHSVYPLHFTSQWHNLGNYFGLGTYIAQRYPDLVGPAVRRIRTTRVDWVREEFTANRLHHRTLGPYRWGVYDSVISRERAAGFHILGLLDYNNTFNRFSHVTMFHGQMVKLVADFVRYVTAVVHHYRNQIYTWQVWNEPDIHEFWAPHPDAKDYAYLLTQAYAAIKAANPDAQVLVAGPSGRDIHAFRFLNNVVRSGGKFDILSIQPYTDLPGQPLLDEIHRLRSLHKPIWFTEIGWAGQIACPRCGNSAFQSKRLATLYFLSGVSGIGRVFWYDFRDDGLGGSFPDHFGLVEWNLGGKQAFRAYELSSYLLNRATIAAVDHVTPSLALYKIRKHGRVYYVAWNNSSAWRDVSVSWDLPAVRVVGSLGNQVRRSHRGAVMLYMGPDSIQYLVSPKLRLPRGWPKGLPIFPGHTR